jgi:type 1 glutamine amidotransferase
MAVSLEDRRALGVSGSVLLELSRLQPPEAPPWPWRCANCAGPRVPVTPLFVSVGVADPASVAAVAQALLPAMGYRVNEISRKTPSTAIDQVPPAEREAIEAALPREPLAKPKTPRKLLVIDLCPQGGYYHRTAAHANLALTLMAKSTGAFEPVFNNDLANLKYPAIRQFDAVFLNSTAGELFSDPEVLAGLTRFVREGGGLAGIHGATYASMILPEFSEMIGAADGPHRVEQATLKIDDPASPLTRAFGGQGFTYVDEFYHFLPTGPYSREKLHVLLSIDTARSDMSSWKVRPDNDYGLVWIRNYGKGRVFNCALGHTPTLFATPALATMILGGVQFVLGDLEADATPSARPSSR